MKMIKKRKNLKLKIQELSKYSKIPQESLFLNKNSFDLILKIDIDQLKKRLMDLLYS